MGPGTVSFLVEEGSARPSLPVPLLAVHHDHILCGLKTGPSLCRAAAHGAQNPGQQFPDFAESPVLRSLSTWEQGY